jgi:hypothetical protein
VAIVNVVVLFSVWLSSANGTLTERVQRQSGLAGGGVQTGQLRKLRYKAAHSSNPARAVISEEEVDLMQRSRAKQSTSGRHWPTACAQSTDGA